MSDISFIAGSTCHVPSVDLLSAFSTKYRCLWKVHLSSARAAVQTSGIPSPPVPALEQGIQLGASWFSVVTVLSLQVNNRIFLLSSIWIHIHIHGQYL